MTHECDPVKNRWTKKDNEVLLAMHANGCSFEEIGTALYRTADAVATHYSVLKNGRHDQPNNNKNKTIAFTIEVMAYKDAPWAPRVSGVTFDWAWRVSTDHTENCCKGVAIGSRKQAEKKAKDAARRIADILHGKPILNFAEMSDFERSQSRANG